MSTLQTVIIIITVVIFFGRLFFGVFKRFSPFDHAASNEQVDFSGSDYNIVNIDTDASANNTDNEQASNRVGINASSSEGETGGGNGAISSSEEGTSPISSSKLNENGSNQPKSTNDSNDVNEAKTSAVATAAKAQSSAKTSRIVVKQSVRETTSIE